eukprot:CAMPEP_0180712316 /NCGR_PEP_ID=MMETSP1038_2-20121128/11311_1 /TAXON_ID=632150 /ORGANISM="Azadinium spinosum, Strain 3D9" /LENGTH=65 /DNA_ID=CAMNT_0022744581 /DNA_START=406 /DNA_END=604 /DNA_ORIENTATION=+
MSTRIDIPGAPAMMDSREPSSLWATAKAPVAELAIKAVLQPSRPAAASAFMLCSATALMGSVLSL